MGLRPRQRAGQGLDDRPGGDHLGEGFGVEIGHRHLMGGLGAGNHAHGRDDEKSGQQTGAAVAEVGQGPFESDAEDGEEGDRRVEHAPHGQDVVEHGDGLDEGERTRLGEHPSVEQDR